MPDVCATVDGENVCMPVDLTVFDDPRQDDVEEAPGDPPGAIVVTGDVPVVRTRVARGAVPDGWPREERVHGELVRGQEHVACEVLVRVPEGAEDGGALELILIGNEVFRAIMGREP